MVSSRSQDLLIRVLVLYAAASGLAAVAASPFASAAAIASETALVAQGGGNPANSPSGWRELRGAGLVLSLPARYRGGNPNTDLDRLTADLTAIDPQYAQSLQGIRENPGALAFIAFDPTSASSGFLTNVTIAPEPVPADVTIEQYLAAAVARLTELCEVESQGLMTVGGYPTARIVGQFTAEDLAVKRLFYAIKVDRQFWVVTYATTAGEFATHLPDFERSIQTLRFGS